MAVQLIESPDGPMVHIPLNLKRTSGRKRIVVQEETARQPMASGHDSAYRNAMVVAVARAFRWKRLLDDGKYHSIAEMARALKINRWYMARVLRLTLLAPDIVEAVLDGQEPDGFSLNRLVGEIPVLWEEQRTDYGFELPAERSA